MLPSTMPPRATQIPASVAALVGNISAAGKQKHRAPDRQQLQQLLTEYFEAEVAEPSNASAAYASNDMALKLIEILTTMGVSVLLEDDPFSPTEASAEEAKNSLLIIGSTIRRTPEVILETISYVDPARSSAPLPPLCLWLAVKLLPVLACPHAEEVAPATIQTLQCIISSLSSMPEGWNSCRLLLQYCTSSLECISFLSQAGFPSSLSVIELNTDSSECEVLTSRLRTRNEFDTKCRVKLPPESFVATCGLPYADSLQFVVRDLDSIILLSGRIFATLSVCLAAKQDSPRIDWQTTAPALFNSVDDIWRAQKILAWNSALSGVVPTFKKELMGVVAEILDSAACSDIFIAIRAGNFALRMAIDTLNMSADDICNQQLELPLSSILLLLLHFARLNYGHSQTLALRVYPLASSHVARKQSWEIFQKDFQLTLLAVLLHCSTNSETKNRAAELLREGGGNSWKFRDKALEERFKRLEEARTMPAEYRRDDGEGARKRRKLSRNDDGKDGSTMKRLVRELYKSLGDLEADDMAGFTAVASINFDRISEDAKCNSMKLLGIIACTSANQVLPVPHDETIGSSPNDWNNIFCALCDKDGPHSLKDRKIVDPLVEKESFATLEKLCDSESFQDSARVRVWAMMSLRRLINHTESSEYLSITGSTMGKWCLQSLQSSKRELRLAASRVLPCYIGGGTANTDPQIIQRNRHIIMEFLRNYSERDEPEFLETCLMTYSQIIRVSEKEEQELSLNKLIGYLGHENGAIMGMAYNEIENLPKALNTSLRRLLLPFMRTVAVSAVKQLQSRPQICQILSDLIGKSVDEFLTWTEQYTMPYMVLMKKTEIIERIAKAHDKDMSTGSLITKLSNLPAIVSLLLTQGHQDVERQAIAALRTVSEDFRNVELAELLRSHEIGIAAELLKSYTSGSDMRASQVLYGLKILATHCVRKTGGRMKSDNILPLFFEQNALGIMAQFSDEIHDVRGKQSITEKERILKGIEAMLLFAKSSIAHALPQVCACLQSALEIEALRAGAIDAWSAIFTALPESEVVSLLVQTISLIMQYWEDFNEGTRKTCFDLIQKVFEMYSKKIELNAGAIPSLAGIPIFAKYQQKIVAYKSRLTIQELLREILKRCTNENGAVVDQALKELEECLDENSAFVHSTSLSEQPDPIIGEILRCLLDSASEHRNSNPKTQRLLARCLGLIGAVDPARISIANKEEEVVYVLHNFERADESIRFVAKFLETKLVKAFLSATDTKAQGFLAYTMQELLKFCGFDSSVALRPRHGGPVTWDSLSTTARNALTPFLTSKYVLGGEAVTPVTVYPIFRQRKHTHRSWLQTFILDLLSKACGDNARMIFGVCSKVIKGQDIGIALFLLPYIVLNIIIGCEDSKMQDNISHELMTVLTFNDEGADPIYRDTVKHCSETVFMLVDRLNRWVEEKRKFNIDQQAQQARQANRHMTAEDEDSDDFAVQRVEKFLRKLPVDVMGLRSFECNAYARALFYWEQHIRNVRGDKPDEKKLEPLYQQMQHIYSQIDEPDGVEGISTKLHYFTMQQQIVEHTKAGRWGPVQIWYEKRLQECPNDLEAQRNLLQCLRETGQYDNIMLQVEKYLELFPSSGLEHIPVAVEAAWSSEQWSKLDYYLRKVNQTAQRSSGFEIFVGQALSALRQQDIEGVKTAIAHAQEDLIKKLSPSVTGSIRQCRDVLLRLQMLSEIEGIYTALLQGKATDPKAKLEFNTKLDRRLDILGSSSIKDKQELLSARRAVFQLAGVPNTREAVASMWLTSGRLARKAGQSRQSFDAVLSAEKLGSPLATIEHCRLLWNEGNHRKAINCLEGVIAANIMFTTPNNNDVHPDADDTYQDTNAGEVDPLKLRIAKAELLHCKWLDLAGQTHSNVIVELYKRVSGMCLRWEQGHYYLGRHYNKIYETEKTLPLEKNSESYAMGELTKLICQNYLRAAAFGTKHIYQTVPRCLTLWLDFGELMRRPYDNIGGADAFKQHIAKRRKKEIDSLHHSVKKYTARLQPYIWYIAYSQILSRITHANESVYELLERIIVTIVSKYPAQALWALLAVCKSTQKDRSTRGNKILQLIKDDHRKTKQEKSEVRLLVNSAQRMNSELLQLANFEIVGKQATLSLSRDIFRHQIPGPCMLVVPAQSAVSVNLPRSAITQRTTFSPFPASQPTIAGIMDAIEVMNSLQKPRKIVIKGSDGRLYPFLVKPKDDLRKDARLMEFNIMINRLLKKDPESSFRNLHIRTYNVTPLNEECGLIEWVNNMRALRDIIFRSYRNQGRTVNFNEIRGLLDEACSSDDKTYIFTDVVLPKFPPILHTWFVSKFPEPSSWFASRLSYARTAAVMSMVGHVLGLGDRHGENILFDETNGEALHVDFNCLFDKGQTFDKPERVPFRLTHNMVDALGVTGIEGPFRRTCEVSTRVLRTYEDTLMTVLETFLHDPAVDMIKRELAKFKPPIIQHQRRKQAPAHPNAFPPAAQHKKSRRAAIEGMSSQLTPERSPDQKQKRSGEKHASPQTPRDVLDIIRSKLQGRFTGETVPLSVEGQVQELIRAAICPKNLCAMYIGWMSFF